jgi:signal peptidase I
MDTLQSAGELQKPKKAPSKGKKVFFACLRIFWVVFFVLVISASSQVIYDYCRYESFFVNGDSMYPTINSNARKPSPYNNEVNSGDWGNFGDGYTCDYGFMDRSTGFTRRLERFDIVVTFYDKDYDSLGNLLSTADRKIKRVIGLPGEKIYFALDGSLYVNDEFVEQTFSTNHLSDTVSAGSGAFYATPTNPVTLGDDQYFLCGDNRKPTRSDDSRSKDVGPVSERCLVGQAIAISAMCTISVSYDASGSHTTPHILFNTVRMPWGLQYL